MDKKDSPTDSGDEGESRGLTGSLGLIAAALLVIGVVGAGLTIAQSPMEDDTGEEKVTADSVLEGVGEKYNSSETVVGNATVEVSKDGEKRSYAVSFVATEENESRLSLEGENRSVVMGSNGSSVWFHSEKAGLTRVYSREEIRDGEMKKPFLGKDGFNRSHHGDGYTWDSVGMNATEPWDADSVGNHSHSEYLNMTSEYVGTQTVRGKETQVVETTVRHQNSSSSREALVTYWVSEDDVVLRQRTETPNATVTVDVTQTRFNVTIADSTFEPPTEGDSTQLSISTYGSFEELQDSTEFEIPRLTSYGFEEGRKMVYAGETAAIQEYMADGNGSSLRLVSAESTDGSMPSASKMGHASNMNRTSSRHRQVETDGGSINVTVSETSRGVAASWIGETDDEVRVRHAVISETGSLESVLDVVKRVG